MTTNDSTGTCPKLYLVVCGSCLLQVDGFFDPSSVQKVFFLFANNAFAAVHNVPVLLASSRKISR